MKMTRDEHAAMILSKDFAWQAYDMLHANLYKSIGAKKYKMIDNAGNIIANASSAEELIGNAGTLRHEDFLTIRERIQETRRHSLIGISDLMAAGLSFPVDISNQIIGFEKVNVFNPAAQEMNPNKFDDEGTEFTEEFTPLPITHKSFSIPWRQQGFDYKRSIGLTESTRMVAERLEDTLFNGNSSVSVTYNGVQNPIYGYTNHPLRGTGQISDWTNIANRDNIVPEVIEQVSDMWSTQGGIPNGSLVLYVSNSIWNLLQNDYIDGQVSESILSRLKKIAQIKDVKPALKINVPTTAILVEMSSRTIELAVAADLIAIPHAKTNPMAPQKITTYASMVHQIKSGSDNITGIRHLTV